MFHFGSILLNSLFFCLLPKIVIADAHLNYNIVPVIQDNESLKTQDDRNNSMLKFLIFANKMDIFSLSKFWSEISYTRNTPPTETEYNLARKFIRNCNSIVDFAMKKMLHEVAITEILLFVRQFSDYEIFFDDFFEDVKFKVIGIKDPELFLKIFRKRLFKLLEDKKINLSESFYCLKTKELINFAPLNKFVFNDETKFEEYEENFNIFFYSNFLVFNNDEKLHTIDDKISVFPIRNECFIAIKKLKEENSLTQDGAVSCIKKIFSKYNMKEVNYEAIMKRKDNLYKKNEKKRKQEKLNRKMIAYK